jgi:hypothetical protein
MDKTNWAIKISRRLTEIEELKTNKDLSPYEKTLLIYEYEQLAQELENLTVANHK